MFLFILTGLLLVSVLHNSAFDINGMLAAETEIYTVTYDANAKGMFDGDNTRNVVTYTTVTSGLEAVSSGNYKEPKPTNPADRFVGWYTNAECANGYEFDLTSLSSDMKIYAKY